MATAVYFLCCLASVACALALFKCYLRARSRLLFWSGICFLGMALNNILLVVDLVVFPQGPDLYLLRTFPLLAGLGLLIYGMIWDTV